MDKVTLTPRGRLLVSWAAVLGFLVALGFAGWIETGM